MSKINVPIDTKNVLTVLIAFSDNANLEENISETIHILGNHIGTKDIETYIVKA